MKMKVAQISAGLALFWSCASRANILEPIRPLQIPVGIDMRKVKLGEKLFYEKKLSRDETLACQSCHDLDKGGADAKKTSTGIDGQVLERNAPTVFNTSLNFRQFWDGRAGTLEEQVEGPVTSLKEMSGDWEAIVKKISLDPFYVNAFLESFDGPPTRDNIKKAIAEFERSLVTVNSRFDRYLLGEQSAISSEELEGYLIFKSYGCSSCHQGENVGGNMYEKFGVIGNFLTQRGIPTQSDLGLFNITGREADKYRFKVPSLRNVARTAPYFHDGSQATLEGAIQIMAKYQLGREISSSDIRKIKLFLEALTGTYQGKDL